jgi:hypothetical protein
MLSTVCQVSAGLSRDLGDGYRKLQNITYAVEAYSPIDKIIYVEYDVPQSNPIWGQFRKYGRLPSVYTHAEVVVEILYARHLSEDWRRLVVCKELCHALDADEGTHSVSDKSLERLVDWFSLRSANKSHSGKNAKAFDAELLAELGAVELLCPLHVRKAKASDNIETCMQLCRQFGIPEEYCIVAFDSEFMQTAEALY